MSAFAQILSERNMGDVITHAHKRKRQNRKLIFLFSQKCLATKQEMIARFADAKAKKDAGDKSFSVIHLIRENLPVRVSQGKLCRLTIIKIIPRIAIPRKYTASEAFLY